MKSAIFHKSRFLTLDEVRPDVDLAGCWHLATDQRFEYRLPSHLLFLLESGQLETKTPGARLTAKAGDLICFRPTDFNVDYFHGPALFYQAHMEFAPPPRHRLTPWLNEIGPLPLKVSLGDAFTSARQAFETICIELRQPGAAHQLRIRAAVLEILAIIVSVATPQIRVATRLDEWQRMRLRLDSDLTGHFRVKDLAVQMGISADHFIRQFKQRFSISPKSYHTHARMREAVRLLRSSDQPIKTIAYGLGFANPKSFTCSFKRHLGVGPSDLRSMRVTGSRKFSVKSGNLFPMNQNILPPHAGRNWLAKWALQKGTSALLKKRPSR